MSIDFEADNWVLFNLSTRDIVTLTKKEKDDCHRIDVTELAKMIACVNRTNQVIGYLLTNMDKRNEIRCSKRAISKATKISEPTVKRIFRDLFENNFLRQINHGVYIINPSVIFCGNQENKTIVAKTWDDYA